MQMAFRDTDHRSAVAAPEAGDLQRLRLLYGLMARLQQACTRDEVYAAAAASLIDGGGAISFAVLYAISEDGARALLTELGVGDFIERQKPID